MEKQALLSMLEDLAPPQELFEGVEVAQSAKELMPLLDAELQRCANRMQRIQQYRNKLSSPMYTLLPELLSKIFVIYAQDQHELFNMRWARLLLVCRRWYDVGVSTPKLWSYISLIEPSTVPYHVHGFQPEALRLAKRVEAQLARAGTAPLTIKAGAIGRSLDVSDCLKPYKSIFWRPGSLASLSLSGDKAYVATILKAMAGHRYPILKDLTISYDGTRFTIGAGHIQPSPPSNTPVSVPDSLLGDVSPKLTTISIVGLTLNWALVKNLRVLHVTFDDNTLPATSLENIADALVRCPLLEDLRMMLPTSFLPNGTALSTTVPLRNLRKATIRGNSDICAALFQTFTDMPRTARISLLSANASTSQQISLLSSLLGTHGRIDGAPTIRIISLAHGAVFATANGVGVTITVNGNVQGGEFRTSQLCVAGRTYLDRQRHLDMPFNTTPTGSIHMSLSAIPNNDTTPEIVLADILQSWPLEGATCLDLRACRLVSIEIWRALFDNAPSITTVVLRPESPAFTTLLELLRAALRDYGRRVVKNIIFDIGEISYGPMSSFFGGGVQESPTTRARLNLMRILQYCRDAAQAGVPLDTVELVNDNIHMQTDRMVQVVPETDWSELYRDLGEGFIYESVLRNGSTGSKGVKKDSFVGSKSVKAHHRYARPLLF